MQNFRYFTKELKIELFRKFIHKIFSKNFTKNKQEYLKWLYSNSKDLSQICKNINSELWNEATNFQKNIILNKKEICKKKVNKSFICRAGTEFIYFVTILKKPNVVIETGVGLGFSSLAFLYALNENNKGRLYSSDLPYIKYNQSEKYIGYVVDDKYKKNWVLLTKGDVTNLKIITNEIEKIDIFHYDSDKTYLGTQKAFEILKKYFHKDTIMIFDDLLDHTFFYDLVNSGKYKFWGIYNYKGNFIGYIGNLNKS